MNGPLLEFRELRLTYGSRTVLDGVSGQLPEGRIVALVGPNGCGKTTLMKSVLGLARPTGGSVSLLGRKVGEWDRRELAAFASYLPQAADSYWDLSVERIVRLGLAPLEALGRPYPAICWPELKEKYELEALWSRSFRRLSGGEKARALMAMSMIRRPRLLLADEPSASMDVGQAWQLLRRLREERAATTVLLVAHDLNLALAVADEVWVMDGGRLAARGEPASIFRNPLIDEVFRQRFHRHVCASGLALVPMFSERRDGGCEY